MKTRFVKLGMLTLALGTFLFTSCSKDEAVADETTETSALTAEESQLTAEADETTDASFNMIDIAYAEVEEEAGRNLSYFPDCVTITISMENGVKFVTLDFGLGCELRNGAIVSGIVNLTYVPSQAATLTITFAFDNFVYNDKAVAGGGSIFRERNNANGNPQSTVDKDIVITYPSGTTADVTGTRVAEWIEGVGSGTWVDNAFLVTGNRDIDVSTGFTHSAIVTEALRREATCPFFVSGVIDITRNNGEGSLDYGEGVCDNLATLIVNGEEYTIILNR